MTLCRLPTESRTWLSSATAQHTSWQLTLLTATTTTTQRHVLWQGIAHSWVPHRPLQDSQCWASTNSQILSIQALSSQMSQTRHSLWARSTVVRALISLWTHLTLLLPAATRVSGGLLPNGVDNNFAACVSYVLEGYTTQCVLTDPEGTQRISTSWSTEFNATSPPALLLNGTMLLQVYVVDGVLWQRTLLLTTSTVGVPVNIFNLTSTSGVVQLSVTRHSIDEAIVSVVQASGAITLLKCTLSSQQLLDVFTAQVTDAEHLRVTNLYGDTSLAVYASSNSTALSTTFIDNSTTHSQSIASGLNIQRKSNDLRSSQI